jgi:hypothetical protein
MPNYLDFERATAFICGGVTSESKAIFDVIVPSPGALPYGISCKMASAQAERLEASFMEMSNSQKKFADEFARQGIDWRTEPDRAGPAIVDLVMSWHAQEMEHIDLDSSRYLVLAHSKWSNFQLLCYTLDLAIADPRSDVVWVNEGGTDTNPSTVAGYITVGDRQHRLWQLYQRSGGQLKYYPLLEWAEWTSNIFQLEEPPITDLREKVETYFPGMWPD